MTDESGFTLVEVMVAIALSLLLTGLAFSTYLFVVQRLHAWRTGLQLENAFHTIHRQISADLYRTAELLSFEGDAFSVRLAAGDTATYVLRDSVLARNGSPMHPPSLAAASLHVAALPASRRAAGRQVDVRSVEIALTLQVRPPRGRRGGPRADALSGTTRVSLRAPADWAPVPGPARSRPLPPPPP